MISLKHLLLLGLTALVLVLCGQFAQAEVAWVFRTDPNPTPRPLTGDRLQPSAAFRPDSPFE